MSVMKKQQTKSYCERYVLLCLIHGIGRAWDRVTAVPLSSTATCRAATDARFFRQHDPFTVLVMVVGAADVLAGGVLRTPEVARRCPPLRPGPGQPISLHAEASLLQGELSQAS